ncbi:hypothetical protein Scep_012465 [Stephania cephalantha]|uniref:Uncharacterized protein n=1 Tax=Stephania cephalantha TaxID=152367 RepID=A0AAP0P6H7_9MAGN
MQAKLQRRRQELTQTTPDQPVDDEAMYYKRAGECPKGRVYGLGLLGRKKRRYADADASTSQLPCLNGSDWGTSDELIFEDEITIVGTRKCAAGSRGGLSPNHLPLLPLLHQPPPHPPRPPLPLILGGLQVPRPPRHLLRFLAICTFDPRYIDFVGDDALIALSLACPYLTLLHLADPLSLSGSRPDSESYAFAAEDARITAPALEEVFRRLTSLEELVLHVGQNVRDSGHALEALDSNCLELKSLKLGHFHGVCFGVTSKLDGVAVCKGLECLSLRNCGDLTDSGLMAIALGCHRFGDIFMGAMLSRVWDLLLGPVETPA